MTHDASPAPALAVRTAAHAVDRRLRPTAPLALIGLAALAPFAVSASNGVLDDMILAAAYVVMALGLNIVVGFAGLLDLGYVAFVAIGAYTAAYFASGFWANAGSDGQGVAILAERTRGRICPASTSTSCWSSSLPWRRRRSRAR